MARELVYRSSRVNHSGVPEGQDVAAKRSRMPINRLPWEIVGDWSWPSARATKPSAGELEDQFTEENN